MHVVSPVIPPEHMVVIVQYCTFGCHASRPFFWHRIWFFLGFIRFFEIFRKCKISQFGPNWLKWYSIMFRGGITDDTTCSFDQVFRSRYFGWLNMTYVHQGQWRLLGRNYIFTHFEAQFGRCSIVVMTDDKTPIGSVQRQYSILCFISTHSSSLAPRILVNPAPQPQRGDQMMLDDTWRGSLSGICRHFCVKAHIITSRISGRSDLLAWPSSRLHCKGTGLPSLGWDWGKRILWTCCPFGDLH